MRAFVSKLVAVVVTASALALSAGPVGATVLVIDQGKLMGANGLEVVFRTDPTATVRTFNVRFVDGTCAEVFNGCDEDSDFFFSGTPLGDRPDNASTLQALLREQVLTGIYDTSPELVNGCESAVDFSCGILLPFTYQPHRTIWSTITNGQGGGFGSVFSRASLNPQFCGFQDCTWAVWSEAEPVPAPAAWLWLLMGAASLLVRSRRSGG